MTTYNENHIAFVKTISSKQSSWSAQVGKNIWILNIGDLHDVSKMYYIEIWSPSEQIINTIYEARDDFRMDVLVVKDIVVGRLIGGYICIWDSNGNIVKKIHCLSRIHIAVEKQNTIWVSSEKMINIYTFTGDHVRSVCTNSVIKFMEQRDDQIWCIIIRDTQSKIMIYNLVGDYIDDVMYISYEYYEGARIDYMKNKFAKIKFYRGGGNFLVISNIRGGVILNYREGYNPRKIKSTKYLNFCSKKSDGWMLGTRFLEYAESGYIYRIHSITRIFNTVWTGYRDKNIDVWSLDGTRLGVIPNSNTAYSIDIDGNNILVTSHNGVRLYKRISYLDYDLSDSTNKKIIMLLRCLWRYRNLLPREIQNLILMGI